MKAIAPLNVSKSNIYANNMQTKVHEPSFGINPQINYKPSTRNVILLFILFFPYYP